MRIRDTARMNDSTASLTSPLVALSSEIADAVERAAPSVVGIDAGRRSASGIVWDEHHIVTADHAIVDEDEIDVIVDPDRKYRATLVGRDDASDIALVRVEAALPAPAPRTGFETGLRVGNLTLALARDDDGFTLAGMGIVSALDDAWQTWRGGEVERFIRADIAMASGFSGGALVDVAGRLIGMNTWGLSRRWAITLPVLTLERIAGQLASGGRVPHGYLGIAMQAVRLPAALRSALRLEQQGGAIVIDVAAAGPAEAAGIAIGDVVVAVGQNVVEDADDLQRALAREPIGAVRRLHLLRGGRAHDLDVTIGARPADVR